MADKLSWDEIKRQYPDEYVVLVDLDADDRTLEVHAGVVLAHSRSRKKVLSQTKQALAGKSAAVLFTGEGDHGTFLL